MEMEPQKIENHVPGLAQNERGDGAKEIKTLIFNITFISIMYLNQLKLKA